MTKHIQILMNTGLSEDRAEALLNVAEAFVANKLADDLGNAADVLQDAGFINDIEHQALWELDGRIKLVRDIAAACGD